MAGKKRWFAVSCAVMLGIVALWSIGLGSDSASAFGRGALAGQPNMGPLRGPVGRYLFLLSFADLTVEQRETIGTIVKSRRNEIGILAIAIAEKRRTLREAALSEYVNEEEIRGAASELGKTIGDATVLASNLLREVRQVLTPDQIEKMEALRDARESAVEWLKEIAGPMPGE